MKKYQRHRYKMLSGQKFGRLTVVRFDKVENGNAKWFCECECGNVVSVLATSLKSGQSQSCGCLAKENGKFYAENNLRNKEVQKKAFTAKEKSDRVGKTYKSALTRKTSTLNKSGVKGVLWVESRQKWQVQITVEGKQHYLGSFADKKDAIAARKAAEEKFFKPFLDDN